MAHGLSAWIRPVRERADLELERARRAAAIADRHERSIATSPASTRSLHERMALIHRRIQERHLTAAKLHEAHIQRLERWFVLDEAVDRRPRLISAVAEVLGARSAGIVLLSSSWTAAASTMASDPLAAAAQDLELTLGEGPMHDTTSSGELVVVAEGGLPDRWELYSSAVSELGVRSLVAAPLGLPQQYVGALAVFDPPSTGARRVAESIEEIADALTHTILLTGEFAAQLVQDDAAGDDLMDGPDGIAVVHQAAGMVAAQLGCTTADALALVKARAFTDDELVSAIARRIVARQLRLDTP